MYRKIKMYIHLKHSSLANLFIRSLWRVFALLLLAWIRIAGCGRSIQKGSFLFCWCCRLHGGSRCRLIVVGRSRRKRSSEVQCCPEHHRQNRDEIEIPVGGDVVVQIQQNGERGLEKEKECVCVSVSGSQVFLQVICSLNNFAVNFSRISHELL